MSILWTILIPDLSSGVIAKFDMPGDKSYEPQGFILATVLARIPSARSSRPTSVSLSAGTNLENPRALLAV